MSASDGMINTGIRGCCAKTKRRGGQLRNCAQQAIYETADGKTWCYHHMITSYGEMLDSLGRCRCTLVLRPTGGTMTEQEIRDATPEQLNAMTAETRGWLFTDDVQVIGEHLFERIQTTCYFRRSNGAIAANGMDWCGDWNPAGDIGQAWGLTDSFDAVTIQRDNDVTQESRRCRCTLVMWDTGSWTATGPTTEIAITRAWLLARLATQETE